MDESRVVVLMNRIVFETHRYGLRLCGIPGDALTHDCPERAHFIQRYHNAVNSPECTDLISKGVFPTEALYEVALHEGLIGRGECVQLMEMRQYALGYLNNPNDRRGGSLPDELSTNTLVEWETIINTIVE